MSSAPQSVPAPRAPRAPACPQCDGIGWIHYDVPVGHPQFGQAVRCACQVEADAARRAERARAASDAAPERAECAFSAYDATHDSAALDAAQAWARGCARGDGPLWLFLYGGYGSGKTHLLGGAFYTLLDAGKAPIYTVSPLLLDHIREGIEEKDYAQRFYAVRDCPILILDDLGAESRTRWSEEALFKLVDYRYRLKLPLAVATNLVPTDLEPRIASRLQDRALSRVVRMRGPDWRMREQMREQMRELPTGGQ